jgi:hypothetical protein
MNLIQTCCVILRAAAGRAAKSAMKNRSMHEIALFSLLTASSALVPALHMILLVLPIKTSNQKTFQEWPTSAFSSKFSVNRFQLVKTLINYRSTTMASLRTDSASRIELSMWLFCLLSFSQFAAAFLGGAHPALLSHSRSLVKNVAESSTTSRRVFERMSEECIGAIVTAQKQAQKFNQPEVELPFLVAGIVDMPESAAMERTLKQYGITWRKTTQALQAVYPDQEESSPLGGFFKARDPDDDLPFGKDVQQTLKAAGVVADQMKSTTILPHHLFLAMLEYKEGSPATAVTDSSTNGAYYLITKIDPKVQSIDMCEALLGHLQENDESQRDLVTGIGEAASTRTLDECGVDLTAQAQDGLLDVVQGRDKEIQSCMRTLVRRRKNNVCLIGEAGVGKTSIAEGIAQVLISPECPPRLKGTRLMSLELATLVAGTKYRGEFEERLQSIIQEVTDPKAPPTILFIDEIHNLVGAGAAEGTSKRSTTLHPRMLSLQAHTLNLDISHKAVWMLPIS